ncbi:MAG: arginine--tRNA ligase [Candidatus Taylorbacteria bacterium RIFCSPLOWO2_12_FULL_43_20]|uniref:Arginine--tRNA ligase n=1 Tax=Candidatus Taylorbacteria bacterium RIFCSPLOWO2_12_FULL_43_20 TaxID=1802332 RepID=A0A1G2P125_9BACT|nr:MAG: arginine--tRNA ligase [Candidatus Taylorbacteria bacterium RIFCSPHIGHO2_01_FULL_43_120]OHA22177.1 MAG: arginine--tRNA ligase [Candidatus Taylorbacteria bacterium RIFCSPHIGHO2_02_FULL_43_55]OHA28027.1 MAG: arginine--tRNA ligase [Candidatus Taylorbacteria bacterium RIFCSPHIGHO2_12_FULL_42_34]OHA32260.1 MAG: arginine--tRNA ligase [Candidatus Taylorbacteria bacterium RIFCSPLOWO2_01_FULL_43_83]OHA37853.1 MAG: arginine--tRNA ligase [Candidatus Taylorbacteria bacterium RIFCSPLOWO2_02_FULL_43_2
METKEQAVSSVGERIKKSVAEALSRLKIEGVTFVLEHPDSLIHGDYFTNAAMAAAKKIHKSPRDLAEKIVAEMRDNCPEEIEKIEIAGAGFINFSLSSKFFADSIENILSHSDSFGRGDSLSGQKIMVEYTDPNIFKPFHIGHLMSNAIGESISRIIQFQGADIIRACYPSDVGLHIAKAVWGYLKNEKNAPLLNDSLGKKVEFLGDAYVSGSEAYEKSEQSKKEIDSLNEKIFEKGDEKINSIYDNGKKWSTEHFEEIYECLGTKFDVFIYESEVAEKGKRITNELVEKSVFEKSEGAIIFNGEKFGLHKRVFVTSRGLPTYEAKELGLNLKKFEMFPDITSSMIITGNEQNDYFKVLIKALSLINEKIGNSTRHIGHGMMRFASGKMSSRTGNVITAEKLISEIQKLVMQKIEGRKIPVEKKKAISQSVAVGAIKYSILRQSTGSDICFDQSKSVSFEGDSGPYLQYSYARADSVMRNAEARKISLSTKVPAGWRVTDLEKTLYRFPEEVLRASAENEPHHVTTYLIDLAGIFNGWYAREKIIDADDGNAGYRLALAKSFMAVMKNGLFLLGIQSPTEM